VWNAVWDVDSGAPNELCITVGSKSSMHFWGRMTLEFSRTLPSGVPSGADAGISLHAVNQHCDYLVAETFGCHIKFSQWNPWHVAYEQNSLTTWLLLSLSLKYHRWQSSDTAPGVWYTDVCCHTSRMQWLRSVSLPTNVYMSVASWSCQQQSSIMCAKQTDDY